MGRSSSSSALEMKLQAHRCRRRLAESFGGEVEKSSVVVRAEGDARGSCQSMSCAQVGRSTNGLQDELVGASSREEIQRVPKRDEHEQQRNGGSLSRVSHKLAGMAH